MGINHSYVQYVRREKRKCYSRKEVYDLSKRTKKVVSLTTDNLRSDEFRRTSRSQEYAKPHAQKTHPKLYEPLCMERIEQEQGKILVAVETTVPFYSEYCTLHLRGREART